MANRRALWAAAIIVTGWAAGLAAQVTAQHAVGRSAPAVQAR